MNGRILAVMEYHADRASLLRAGRNMGIMLNAGGEAAGEFFAGIQPTRIAAGETTRP